MKVQVNRIRTDHGGEFSSKDFQQYTTGRGIKHEFSAPYAPEQNGYIERSNRTVVEAVRSLLHAKNLPLGLWAEAVATVVHVLNRSVNKRLNSLTPYELIYKVRPDVSYFRTFESNGYKHIPKQLRSKLEAKSERLVFVGYESEGKAFRVWHPGTRKVSITTDIVVHEDSIYTTSATSVPTTIGTNRSILRELYHCDDNSFL